MEIFGAQRQQVFFRSLEKKSLILSNKLKTKKNKTRSIIQMQKQVEVA